MTEPFAVVKHGITIEMREAPCGTCGQPMWHNLAFWQVQHTDAAVDPCDEPWPNEPRPDWVREVFAQAEADSKAMREGAKALDQLMAAESPAPVWAVRQ